MLFERGSASFNQLFLLVVVSAAASVCGMSGGCFLPSLTPWRHRGDTGSALFDTCANLFFACHGKRFDIGGDFGSNPPPLIRGCKVQNQGFHIAINGIAAMASGLLVVIATSDTMGGFILAVGVVAAALGVRMIGGGNVA